MIGNQVTYCPYCSRTIKRVPERIHSNGVVRLIGWKCIKCKYIPDYDVYHFKFLTCSACYKNFLQNNGKKTKCPNCSEQLTIVNSFTEYQLLKLVKSDLTEKYGDFIIETIYNSRLINSFGDLKKEVYIRTRQDKKRKYRAISHIYDEE